MQSKITTPEMEIAVAKFLNPREKIIIPNVSWGMYLMGKVFHECDLLALTKTGYLWEVEIKISKADLVKDSKKKHGHNHPAIKRLYFAIPDYLLDCVEYIPERAGILVVERIRTSHLKCKVHRKPVDAKGYKMTDADTVKLLRLGIFRLWGLKKKAFKG